MSINVKELPVSDVVVNPAALRTVNFETEDFQKLVTSVKSNGILQPILVRVLKDPETKKEFYGLIDGAHRLEAAKQAGLKQIPVIWKADVSDEAALFQQLVTNLQKVETKPYQYSQALRRLITTDQTLTLPKLAERLGQDYAWVKKRLSLNKLTDAVGEMVDNKRIPLASAYAIAQLPEEEQDAFAKQAVVKPAAELMKAIIARKKELSEQARKGTTSADVAFEPVMHQRKWSEIKAALEDDGFIKSMAKRLQGRKTEDVILEVLRWCAHSDESSLEEQKRKFEEARKTKAEKEAKRAEERLRKKMENKAKEVEDLKNSLAQPEVKK
jgi:ParB family transcriptional regulator, chromosome partitioning protein